MLQVNESTSGLLEADLYDELEALVDVADLDSAVLTLTSAEDQTVINGRTNVNILPFITSNGHLAFPLTPLDTALSTTRKKPEEFRNARIVIAWDGGDKGLTTQIMFSVKRVY